LARDGAAAGRTRVRGSIARPGGLFTVIRTIERLDTVQKAYSLLLWNSDCLIRVDAEALGHGHELRSSLKTADISTKGQITL
jgi:hypothetical protein